MDSYGINTNYSLILNHVTIITDLTKECGITIGRIESMKLVERRELEPKLLSQKSIDHETLIHSKIAVPMAMAP